MGNRNRPIRVSPTANSHSISKATDKLQCRTNSIHLRISTVLPRHSSNGASLLLGSMVRRRLISTERHLLKASMELLLSNSNGAHRLPHKASTVHPLGHPLDSMARRLRRDSMVHHHQGSTAHHQDLHPASMVHPRPSNNMAHRRKASIKPLHNSMVPQHNHPLGMGLSRRPTSMS